MRQTVGARTVRLGDVAAIVRGITFKPEDVALPGTPGSVDCMRTKNVQTELDISDVWAVDASLVRRPEQYLESGDTLISSANSWNLVGKCCWVPPLEHPSTFGGFVSVLRRTGEEVSPRYLYRWFSCPEVQRTIRSFGRQTTNISNLDIGRTLDLDLRLPTITEQQRIIDILDRADTLRAKRRQALVRLDELASAVFVDVFGDPLGGIEWPSAALALLVDEFRYGTSNKSGAAGHPALRIPNVVGGRIDTNEIKLVPVSDAEFARLRLAEGDLLFVRTNGNPTYVGRCATFKEGDVATTGLRSDQFIYASYLIRARLKRERVLPDYVREFMLGTAGRKALLERCKTSAGQYNINIEGLGSIEIPVPPLHLQHEFSTSLATIDNARARILESEGELDSLFGSLQARAFRGEL